jgi:hypothetical protein
VKCRYVTARSFTGWRRFRREEVTIALASTRNGATCSGDRFWSGGWWAAGLPRHSRFPGRNVIAITIGEVNGERKIVEDPTNRSSVDGRVSKKYILPGSVVCLKAINDDASRHRAIHHRMLKPASVAARHGTALRTIRQFKVRRRQRFSSTSECDLALRLSCGEDVSCASAHRVGHAGVSIAQFRSAAPFRTAACRSDR